MVVLLWIERKCVHPMALIRSRVLHAFPEAKNEMDW